jgi:hypothetical protein
MTTSSDHRTPASPRPSGEHWYELTATLSRKSTEAFGDWLTDELKDLECMLDAYVTPRSRLKSRGR